MIGSFNYKLGFLDLESFRLEVKTTHNVVRPLSLRVRLRLARASFRQWDDSGPASNSQCISRARVVQRSVANSEESSSRSRRARAPS